MVGHLFGKKCKAEGSMQGGSAADQAQWSARAVQQLADVLAAPCLGPVCTLAPAGRRVAVAQEIARELQAERKTFGGVRAGFTHVKTQLAALDALRWGVLTDNLSARLLVVLSGQRLRVEADRLRLLRAEGQQLGVRLWDHLPLELQLHVLGYLEVRDLAAFAATCRHASRLAACDQLWRGLCYRKGFAGPASPPISCYRDHFWAQVSKQRRRLSQQPFQDSQGGGWDRCPDCGQQDVQQCDISRGTNIKACLACTVCGRRWAFYCLNSTA